MTPLYDNEDSVCGIIYNGSAYYFYKNLQGDIIEIANRVGTIVARYSYDAWGKVTAITDGTGVDISNNVGHVANANPFRYRGYYYDAEIGMYYLQSRYYDPSVARFINGDDILISARISSAIDHNIYTYCQNNPTNFVDHAGNCSLQLIARIILGIYIGLFAQLLCDIITYLVDRFIFKKPIPFEAHPADYASSMLTWALVCVIPSGKLVKIKNLCCIFIPVIIKHAWKALTRKFDLSSLMYDLAVGMIAFAISCCLDVYSNEKKELIAKRFAQDKNSVNKIATSTLNFNIKMNIWSIKINLGFAIGAPLLQMITSVIIGAWNQI